MSTEPKKGLNISLLVKPQATVTCGSNTIYLYPARASDLDEFNRLSTEGDALSQFRKLLPSIASLVIQVDIREKRDPLPSEVVEQLSDDDLEMLADAYAAIPSFHEVRIDKGENIEAVIRLDGESAVAYIGRLLKAEIERHRSAFQKMRLDAISPASKLLEQVKLSSLNLGESLKAFDKLSLPPVAQIEAIESRSADVFRAMDKHQQKLARERKEELEMTRLTGEMTAQSAKLLQDLTQAASDFLLRFDERSEKADSDTRHQLKIAVISVVVSAFLALFALGVGFASYIQDSGNNVANDQWQRDILELQKADSKRRIKMERELEDLRSQIRQIDQTGKTNALTARASKIEVAAPKSLKGRD